MTWYIRLACKEVRYRDVLRYTYICKAISWNFLERVVTFKGTVLMASLHIEMRTLKIETCSRYFEILYFMLSYLW